MYKKDSPESTCGFMHLHILVVNCEILSHLGAEWAMTVQLLSVVHIAECCSCSLLGDVP